ncbi:MAG: aminotransferase class I/II-fold pyridoxal phosphate-dependent enzyme [Rhodobiaceae bacterium]|nr:aminotransferase class I/II-fold pyridoxal phosphate-dependent enzyme [Rhodobiaceae bacterium]MCC0052984.1 aminotransferase class I/II-fold pyridoxal phosphate-dependent enzyme [Rhodobiaceae bacterium]
MTNNRSRRIAKRGDVEPFIAMDVLRDATRRAATGAAVYHLEIGQPAFSAPRKVLEAARSALDSDALGYTEATGLAALRERIAAHYRQAHGVDVSADRIIVTTGSSGGFILAFLALFEAGDKVALASPGYPAYRNILKALGIDIKWIETCAADRWAPTSANLAALDDAHSLAGMLIASPGNPTGTVIEPDRLNELCATARQRGLWMISDEIYHGLTYGAPADTALSHDPDAIVINSFSKYYCMTGWRIGWMVVPQPLVRTFERLTQNLFICAPAISQVAALAAFDATDELEANKAVYARNRELLLTALPQIGIDRFLPVDGAFYLYADISRFTNDSREFAARLLAQTGVAATPGADFDPFSGDHYLRFSFAGSTDTIERAIAHVDAFLKPLR